MPGWVVYEPSVAAFLRHCSETVRRVPTFRVDPGENVQFITLFADGVDAPVCIIGNYPQIILLFLPDRGTPKQVVGTG